MSSLHFFIRVCLGQAVVSMVWREALVLAATVLSNGNGGKGIVEA